MHEHLHKMFILYKWYIFCFLFPHTYNIPFDDVKLMEHNSHELGCIILYFSILSECEYISLEILQRNWNYERQVKTMKERKKKVCHKSVDEQKIMYKPKKISLEVLFGKVATNYPLCKFI